jgi:acyl-CoA synthetase (AMP-forming)/AMP-acid ligase II/carbonic anhydrase/acetyltransferase-like protein (isoleucine patch superfamily)/acyl carrier protein
MLLSPEPTQTHRTTRLTLVDALQARAERQADAPAILAPGRRDLTNDAFLHHVEATVAALCDAGVERNDRVAVVLPNGPEMAAAFIATISAATCAPLNPAYRREEFEFYLTDLNAKVLLVADEMESPSREVARQRGVEVLNVTVAPDAPAGVFGLNGSAPGGTTRPYFSEPEDTALVLHTSGTTSRPKIVPLTLSNICTSGYSIVRTLDLTEKDRCLNVMPLFHIHGLIAALVGSLSGGGSVVCTPGFDADGFFQWLDTFAPTWYTAVPTIHQAVLARVADSRDVIARRPLRFIRSSSASLPPQVLADLEDVFGTRVIEAYGMTEASHQMASNPLAPAPRKPGSVGVAAGPEIAIMDAKGRLLPPGETGEVVIRGANVTAGYENNPAANQSAFTDSWFRTGDEGRFDNEGYLFLTGRLKEIINRGGEKIAPREVDEVLLQHPSVGQAVAFAVPHPTLGEEVAAAVVLKKNASAEESELIRFAAERLADFKVPKEVLFLESIPKGPTGKLQRIGLADRLADHFALKRQKGYVAPKSSTEEQLTELWKHLLKTDRVGVRDTFHTIGGDSLAMAAMMIKVEQHFGRAVNMDAFLQSPTIETLAQMLEERQESPVSSPAEAPPIRDTILGGLKNRLLQCLALYAPGYKTTRVWLHRLRGVWIGTNVSIGLSALIETAYPSLVYIGNNVTIGMRAIIIAHLRDSTTGARLRGHRTVRIEDDVYIGPGVIILPNVTIGRGAVVGAGSVVSRAVTPKTLVRGNPAVPVARCGVSLGGGVSYEEFLRQLRPLEEEGQPNGVAARG